MFALFYTLFDMLVASLADRANRARVVASACALRSLLSAGCGLAQNFGQLALARISVGIGKAGGLSALLRDHRRLLPAAGARSGAVISLARHPGRHDCGGCNGRLDSLRFWVARRLYRDRAVGMLFARLILFAVPEPRHGQFDAKSTSEQHNLTASLRLFFGNRMLRRASLAGGLSAFVGYSMLSWTPALLMRVHGMTLAEPTIYHGLASDGAIAIGTLLSGQLVDGPGLRDQRMYALLPAFGFLAALPVYVAAIAADRASMTLILITVPFALYSMYLAPVLAIVQNAVQVGWRIIDLIGLGIGPVYIGWTSDWAADLDAPQPFRMAMFALAPVFLLTAISHLALARSLRMFPLNQLQQGDTE